MTKEPEQSRGRQKRIWGALLVVFICGILVGVAGTQEYHDFTRQHREGSGLARMKPRILKHLVQDLNLSDEQIRTIEPMLSRAEAELLQLRMAQQPRVEEIVSKTADMIHATLTADQQRPFDKVLRTLHQRWDEDQMYARRRLAIPPP